MKTYRGIIPEALEGHVRVEEEGRSPRPLDLHLSVQNHSPDGFSWGYGGSGPAQLSLALLIDTVGVERALLNYQAFKWSRIAALPIDEAWVMTSDSIIAWVQDEEARNRED